MQRAACDRQRQPNAQLQVGLNGVDNGAIRFSHVRVPRGNLLDRFASVDKSGRYSSPLTSEVGAAGAAAPHASVTARMLTAAWGGIATAAAACIDCHCDGVMRVCKMA